MYDLSIYVKNAPGDLMFFQNKVAITFKVSIKTSPIVINHQIRSTTASYKFIILFLILKQLNLDVLTLHAY